MKELITTIAINIAASGTIKILSGINLIKIISAIEPNTLIITTLAIATYAFIKNRKNL